MSKTYSERASIKIANYDYYNRYITLRDRVAITISEPHYTRHYMFDYAKVKIDIEAIHGLLQCLPQNVLNSVVAWALSERGAMIEKAYSGWDMAG